MENNIGLPLEFILTCKKTGRNSLGPHMLDLIPTANPLSGGKSLYQIQGTAASNFDDEPVVRQATGFTDAAGNDVFFGDVFAIELQPGKVSFFIVRWVTYRILGVCAFGKIDRASGRVTPHMIHIAHISNYYIVGNAYEPPSRWLERAREIWPGAELPEGVR